MLFNNKGKSKNSGCGVLVLFVIGLIAAYPTVTIPLILLFLIIWAVQASQKNTKMQTTSIPPRPYRSYEPIRTPIYKEKAQSGDECWLKKDATVDIHGFHITCGMIYVGKGLYKRSYPSAQYLRYGSSDMEPCLINSSLSVEKSNINIEAKLLPFYPSYSEATSTARGNYLHWLSTGASDPKAQIGYVFLYFYGLERRFLVDKSKDEWPAIIKEIERLKGIYSREMSFQHYMDNFLSNARVALALETSKRLYLEPRLEHNYFETPLDIKVALGQLVKDQQRLQGDLALAWISTDQATYFRTPVKRASQEFRKLFTERFKKEFPKGLMLDASGPAIKANYRAASGSFEVELDLKDLPDVSGDEASKKKIRSVVETCTNLLEPYSRFLGRNPAKSKSIEAVILLPPELQTTTDNPGLEKIKEMLINPVERDGVVSIKAKDIIKIWPVKDKTKISKKETANLSAFLLKFDIGIVPDGDRVLKSSDYAVVFKMEGSIDHILPSENYKLAAIFIELAAMVVLADDQATEDEVTHLMQKLEDIFKLSGNDKIRLEARMKFFIKNKSGSDRVKSRVVEQIPVDKRPEIASYLLTIVGTDGRIDPSEVKVLANIYKYLGLSQERLYSDLNSLGASSVVGVSDDPVTVRKSGKEGAKYNIPKPSIKRDGPIILNMDMVRMKVKDTQEVSKLLHGIFINEEQTNDEQEKENSEFDEKSPLSSLDKIHQTLLKELSTKEQWLKEEFEGLVASFNLMPEGAVEVINNWSFDHFEEPILEDDNGLSVNLKLYEKALNNG